MLAVMLFSVGAGSVVYMRKPVANGLYYPAEPAKLLAAVNQYMDDAKPFDMPGRYMGCITPHSAYPYCGAVAGNAFRPLKRGQYDRVIVLGSSHFAEFEGCSIPAIQFYSTPLGAVELDGPAIKKLLWCPQIDTRSLTYQSAQRFADGSVRYPLHEVEYSIEVILPYLQARLGKFKLVPIIVGSFGGRGKGIDAAALQSAAEALRDIIDDRTFVVASTDLTHFGNAYGYHPFNEDIPAKIEDLDVEALELLMSRNSAGFQAYMDATKNPICGASVLELFLKLMPADTQGVLLDYTTSAKITGNTDTSVSYAAVAFYNPNLPAPEPKPVTSLEPMAPPAPADAKAGAPPLVPDGRVVEPPQAAPKREAPKKDSQKKGLFHWFGKDKR
jgi:AmmeMemoRadiSam system protein B